VRIRVEESRRPSAKVIETFENEKVALSNPLGAEQAALR
jgi:hypothetical protein